LSKVVSFKPQARDENGDLVFEGNYQIKMPNFIDRMKFVQEVQAENQIDPSLKDEKEIEAAQDQKNMQSAVRMAELASKYITGVNLKHRESGEEFNSFEELQYVQECSLISSECFEHLAKGRALGKASKPRSPSK